MAAVDTDRNLLFGVLALQADLIDAGRFAEACAAWAARKDVPLADVMSERGWLKPEDRRLVERLLEVKLQKHGGDAARSLADVTEGPARQVLASLGDPVVQQTLAGLSRADGHERLSLISNGLTVDYTPESRERYTLTRLHARGGIGQVWLARDADLGRDVALKELRPEQAGNQMIWARFLEEARITGQLEHPNIVPVHELVRPGDGKDRGQGQEQGRQPFYTMRFVKGRTLSDAIRHYHGRRQAGQTGPLDLQELLQVFLGVCHAVAYAHSRGVIHRDLKGQNVVLGNFGEVIVLDWGLAKLVGRAEGPADVAPVRLQADAGHTLQGQALGTPAYMSPEQAEGQIDQVGQRSDVYGLGAILYEILAGQPPFTGSDTLEVLRKVREEEPVPPSQVNPQAPKALEAVCRKALAKRSEDRYASAEELELEIKRWLADEPVTAWREPWTTRARRWLWRYRLLATAAVAAIIVALAGLAGLVTVQTRANQNLQAAISRETKAKDLAEARYQLAEQAVAAFYTGVSEEVMLKQPQLDKLRVQLLETALKFYRQLQTQLETQPDDPSRPNARQGRLLALASASERIAEIYAHIGRRAEAAKAYEEARALWEQADAIVGFPIELSKVFIKLGRLRRQMGQPTEAMRDYQQGVEILERLVESSPSNSSPVVGDLAWALLQVASLQQETGQADEARRTGERARDLTLEKARREKLQGWERQNLAALYMLLGNLDAETHQFEKALHHYEQAHEVLEKLVADSPALAEFRGDLARSENNVGFALTELGRQDEALSQLEHGLAIREQLLSNSPLDAGLQSDVARSAYHLARLHVWAGHADEALRQIKRAETLFAGITTLVPEDRYYRACLLALHIPLIGMGKAELSATERAERAQYADQTMKALQEAVASGYKKKNEIEQERAFEPLRSRADFQELVKGLSS